MKALNFYSSIYRADILADQKRCTIRLGDKTSKYQDGELVWVTYGNRFEPRQKLFTAVIDRVAVKSLSDLTEQDIKAENPQMRSPRDVADFLERIYQEPIDLAAGVSVIHFSRVAE